MEQQENLFSFVCGTPVYNIYAPTLAIMLELGLHCGELIDLTCSDIDMEKKEVSVNHQLIYKDFGDGCRFHVNSPKTKSGKDAGRLCFFLKYQAIACVIPPARTWRSMT